MSKSLKLLVLTALLSFFQIGHANAASLKVVVSIAPLQALTESILGDKGSVVQIVPANMSPHSYTLKPADLSKITNADMIFWIGPQLEFFLNKSMAQLKSSKKIVTVIDIPGLKLFKIRNGENWQDTDHDHPNHDVEDPSLPPSQQLSLDPHLWLDPNNAEVILKSITISLKQIDPQNSDYYTKQLQQRLTQLADEDTQIKQKLAPIKNKPYLVFHDGYQYFEKHYELTDLGTVMINPEIPLSGKQLQEIHQKIQKMNIICVFKEPQTNDRLADRVVNGTSAKLGLLDPLDSGVIAGWDAYPKLLQKNAQALVDCL